MLNIQCVHGYAYSSGNQKICTWVNEESWGIIKTCFPNAKQIKKSKNCYMQIMYIFKKDINGSDENFDSPLDNEPTL